ncbi:MAG: transposase [Myxococcota bacterium]|nr:transposase [Myxococcota bacterium]
MTQPRRIREGATFLITRRALRRHCLFAPDPRITQLFVFALAWCAQMFGVEIHAAILMSTHEHLVVTDVRGVLPMFLQMFHRLVALATKVVRKWEGPVWDHEPPSIVELVTPEAVIQEIGYAIANPAAAGLVERARDWPGVTTLVEQLAGGVLVAARPTFFFSASNPQWGERASVTLTLPPMLEELYTPESFREAVAAEVERIELEAKAAQREKGRAFAGPKRCERISPYRRMKGYEPIRDRNPVIAAGRGQSATRIEAIRLLRTFRAAYRDALDRWRTGLREVVFPAGTWAMARLHAAIVERALATAA